jgi:hypothetical protein
MSVLRYIDRDGRERVIDDVNHLLEQIRCRQIQDSSLVWDEGESRWITARDLELFQRIHEIAADSDAPEPSSWYRRMFVEPLEALRESGTNLWDQPKLRWVKPIKSREEALRAVNHTSTVFFGVAGIQAITGLAVAAMFSKSASDLAINAGLIGVGLYVAFASWLRWGQSRFAALLLLLMALMSFGAKTAGSGITIWLVSVIVFGAACKAVEATFKLPEFEKAPAQEEHQQVHNYSLHDVSADTHRLADLH